MMYNCTSQMDRLDKLRYNALVMGSGIFIPAIQDSTSPMAMDVWIVPEPVPDSEFETLIECVLDTYESILRDELDSSKESIIPIVSDFRKKYPTRGYNIKTGAKVIHPARFETIIIVERA